MITIWVKGPMACGKTTIIGAVMPKLAKFGHIVYNRYSSPFFIFPRELQNLEGTSTNTLKKEHGDIFVEFRESVDESHSEMRITLEGPTGNRKHAIGFAIEGIILQLVNKEPGIDPFNVVYVLDPKDEPTSATRRQFGKRLVIIREWVRTNARRQKR